MLTCCLLITKDVAITYMLNYRDGIFKEEQGGGKGEDIRIKRSKEEKEEQ